MVIRTAAMLMVLLASAAITACGCYWLRVAYKGWCDTLANPDDGRAQPGRFITGTLGGLACFGALVRVAYELAK